MLKVDSQRAGPERPRDNHDQLMSVLEVVLDHFLLVKLLF